MIPLLSNASGGILVGIVTQRLGGVQKGFALILGICLAALVEVFIGGKPLTILHFLSVLFVCISMWGYSSHPYIHNEKKDQ